MFVRRSTYNKALQENVRVLREYDAILKEHAALLRDWNKVVKTINDKGGQAFLDGDACGGAADLSQDDIRRLLQLCHPDKHQGKKVAEEMTAKLLALREGR